VLRPHVHGDALSAAVTHLEDVPRFEVHRYITLALCRSALSISALASPDSSPALVDPSQLEIHCIGEWRRG